tara:strand:- start:6497 stop:7255 length:759 start_codon:yes stop_codon:yes gene_type:complete
MLRLYSAGYNIPHPRKAHRGGEDSWLVSSPTNSTVAVADGVGGWESKGINPRAFADEMLTKTYFVMKNGTLDPKMGIKASFSQLSQVGSATFCMGKLDNEGIFRVANIGDSGFIIIRDGMILLKSAEHQHQFNYPYQLGIGEDGLPHGTDRPQDAEVYQLKLEVGDVVVMGSDGLLDNLWPKEILNYVDKHPPNPMKLAEGLARHAYEISQDEDVNVPFFHRAKQEGVEYASYQGGKEDDITVVISVVAEAE